MNSMNRGKLFKILAIVSAITTTIFFIFFLFMNKLFAKYEIKNNIRILLFSFSMFILYMVITGIFNNMKYNYKLIKIKKITIILISILIILVPFVSYFFESSYEIKNLIKTIEECKNRRENSIKILKNNLSNKCYYYLENEYRDYEISCYLENDSRMTLNINKFGYFDEIVYDIEQNIDISIYENINNTENDLKILNSYIDDLNITTEYNYALQIYELSDNFKGKLLEGTYYDNIYLEEENNYIDLFFSFNTKSKEEIIEYSDKGYDSQYPYIYIYSKSKENY